MEQFIVRLGEVSLWSSAVILILLLMGPILSRRYKARWRYWAWALIALRLVLPFNLSLPVKLVEPQIHNESLYTEESPMPASAPERPMPSYEPDSAPLPEQSLLMEPSLPKVQRPRRTVSFLEGAFLVWLLGALAAALWETAGYCHLRRDIRRWSSGSVSERVERLFRAHNASLPVAICPKISSPMVVGLLSPVVLLPHENYTDEELHFIFTHELVHYRRRDIGYKFLLLAAGVIHWFNPLVWLMRREAERDIEISCDDEVVSLLGQDCREAYARTILSCASGRGGLSPAFTTQFYSGKDTLKKRFSSLFDHHQKHSGRKAMAFMAAAVLLGGGLIGCQVVEEQKEEPSPLPEEAELELQELQEVPEPENHMDHFPPPPGEPDENGYYPSFPAELAEQYIWREAKGEPDTEKPSAPIPALQESPAVLDMMKLMLPAYEDWEIVTQMSDYIMVQNVYDPQRYLYRDQYVPMSIAVLSTESSSRYDRVFVIYTTYCNLGLQLNDDEERVAVPQRLSYIYIHYGRQEDWGREDYENAVPCFGGYDGAVSCFGLWFPDEELALAFEENSAVVPIRQQKKPMDYKLLSRVPVQEYLPSCEDRGSIMTLSESPLQREKGYQTYSYQDERQVLHPMEFGPGKKPVISEEPYMNYMELYPSGQDILLMRNRKQVYWFDFSAEEPWKSVHSLGEGQGLKGKNIQIEALTQDRSNPDHYAVLYWDDDRKNWNFACFDDSGHVFSDFEATFPMMESLDTVGFAFDRGLLYLDYPVSGDLYEFCADGRAGADHTMRHYMIKRNYQQSDFQSYSLRKVLFYPVMTGQPFERVEDITCWPEIAERIIDLSIEDPRQNFWTRYPGGRISISQMVPYLQEYFPVDEAMVRRSLQKRPELLADGDTVQYRPHEGMMPLFIWEDYEESLPGGNGFWGRLPDDTVQTVIGRVSGDGREIERDYRYLVTMEEGRDNSYRILSMIPSPGRES